MNGQFLRKRKCPISRECSTSLIKTVQQNNGLGFHFSCVYTWEGTAVSYGNYVTNHLRDSQIVFQSDCAAFYSPAHRI